MRNMQRGSAHWLNEKYKKNKGCVQARQIYEKRLCSLTFALTNVNEFQMKSHCASFHISIEPIRDIHISIKPIQPIQEAQPTGSIDI